MIISQQDKENYNYPIGNFSLFNILGENKSVYNELNADNKNILNSEISKMLKIENTINISFITQNNFQNNQQNIEDNISYLGNFYLNNAKESFFHINNNSNSNVDDELSQNDISSSTKTLVELNNILINDIQKNVFYNIMNFFEKFFAFISGSLAINKINQKSIDYLTDEQIDKLQKFIIDFEKLKLNLQKKTKI